MFNTTPDVRSRCFCSKTLNQRHFNKRGGKMNVDKNESVSHATDISDQMLNFINKEGANSFPTITVLLNRVFLASDQYEWVKNSNIDVEFPKLKEKDDIHWYKTTELYTNVKNSLNTLLNKSKLFQETPLQNIDKLSKFYTSKTKLYRVLNKSVYIKDSMSSDETECIAELSGTIKDVLTIKDYDFILTSSAIYRVNTKSSTSELVYSSNSSLNAFDSYETNIVVTSSDGGIVFSDVLNTFSKDGEIRYSTYTLTTPSTETETETAETINTSYTNNLPSNNKCTFVYFESGSSFSIGNTSTSGRFTLGGTYTATMTDNKGLEVKSENMHCCGVNGVSVAGGYKISNKIYKTENHVFSFYSDDYITLLVTSEGIEVFINNKDGTRETVFTISNNGIVGTPEFIYKEDKDLYIKTSSGVFKTFDVDSTDNPIVFILFSFIYDEDNSKDKIDMRQAKLSIPEIISLAYSQEVFNKYMANSLNKNTNFIIAYGKTTTEKTVFNLYGDDTRRNLAKEIKMCASAFDIGID